MGVQGESMSGMWPQARKRRSRSTSMSGTRRRPVCESTLTEGRRSIDRGAEDGVVSGVWEGRGGKAEEEKARERRAGSEDAMVARIKAAGLTWRSRINPGYVVSWLARRRPARRRCNAGRPGRSRTRAPMPLVLPHATQHPRYYVCPHMFDSKGVECISGKEVKNWRTPGFVRGPRRTTVRS
jgi:hypothetical protein